MPDRHADTPVTPAVHVAACNRIDKLLRRRAIAGRLLQEVSWGARPLKELSESLAVFDVALDIARARRWRRDDPRIRVVVVGDGHSPRTGALVALSTAWSVVSVDPIVRPDGPHPTIERLVSRRARIEDLPELVGDLVLAPHSHAPPAAIRAAARGGGHVIALPCCVPWPRTTGTLKQVSGVCMAPDRTVYVERVA